MGVETKGCIGVSSSVILHLTVLRRVTEPGGCSLVKLASQKAPGIILSPSCLAFTWVLGINSGLHVCILSVDLTVLGLTELHLPLPASAGAKDRWRHRLKQYL